MRRSLNGRSVMRQPILRPGRLTLKLAAAVSLALCGVTAALWVRGYFVADIVSAAWVAAAGGRAPVAHEVNARSEGGVLLLQTMSRPLAVPLSVTGAGPPGGLRWGYQGSRPRLDLPPSGQGPRWLSRGARIAWRASPKGGGVDRWLILPCWLLMLPGAACGGWRLRRWLRARRAARLGLCSRCGYDLRASPERCPECGTGLPAPTVAAASPAAGADRRVE